MNMCFEAFRNTVALEKDEEQVSFINMRIKALWECSDQDEELWAKQVSFLCKPILSDFNKPSCEPIPPLVDEPGELIDMDDDLREDSTIASLSGVNTTAIICEESSQGDEDENDVDTFDDFNKPSCEPIPPLVDEPGELIDLDDDLREDPMIASLSGVDTTVVLCEKRSQGDEVENYVDTLVIM